MKKSIIALLLFFLAFILSNQEVNAQDIDSLYAVFSSSGGATQIGAANEILKYCYEKEHIDSLITLKTTDEKAFVDATIFDAMGAYYMFEIQNYEKSIEFFKQGLENYEKIGNLAVVNLQNSQIGVNYVRLGDYENAVVYLLKCYEWEKSVGDYEGLSSSLNNLGVLYSRWQKPEIAIRYFEEAVNVERPLNRPMQYAMRLAQLAREYLHSDATQSLPLIKEALLYNTQIASQALREDRIATHTSIMGDIYYALDSLDNAENCYKIALAFFEKNERAYDIATTLQQLGRLQIKSKQWYEAIATLKRCEEIAENNKYMQIQHQACGLLSEAYSHIEPNSMSYFYLKKYSVLNESIFNETTQNQINDFQIRYQTAEKQLEIERQQTEIERHKTRQLRYMGGLIATAMLVMFLIYIVRLRTRSNRELAAANATKDKFFSIISHDLKNPAIAQRDAIQLLLENPTKWDEASLTNYYRKLLKSAKGQVELLYALLDWAQLQTGRMPFQLTQVDLVAFMQSNIGLIRDMADAKGIAFNVKTPAAAVVVCDNNMLTTVVRNLLINAIKYTAKGGSVTFDISPGTGGQSYVVSVTDTGTGMSAEQIQNLFRLDKPQSRHGTDGEQGSGLGLIVCRELLQKHGSVLHIESEEGKGSRFWFQL
jgi:signal transduction histidine kinase